MLFNTIAKTPTELLLTPSCRKALATSRWQQMGEHIEVFDVVSGGVMPGTVTHNRRELEQGLFGSTTRTARLINPLSALEPIYSNAMNLKVLSIGPRTEMEIYHLMGIGFTLPNITAIDLLSSSPLIDLGDMHKMPYDDRSFDVVISSWVLNYSKDPQTAIDEMVRVTADGGIVAIGLTYAPEYGADYIADNPAEKDIVGSMQRSVDDLKRKLGPRLEKIYFQQDPDSDKTKGAVMLIGKIKHA